MGLAEDIQFVLDNENMDSPLFMLRETLLDWKEQALNAASLKGPFEFSYDTPGLADGVPFYTAKAGEVLLDAMMTIITPWNGITPLGDFGAIPWDAAHNDQGYFGFGWDAVHMDYSTSDTAELLGDYARAGTQLLSQYGLMGMAWAMLKVPAISGNHAQQSLVRIDPDPFDHPVPIFYEGDTPLSVAVSSTDGIPGGGDPGATQGLARISLLIASFA